MNNQFSSFMIDELRALVSQIEGRQEPENDDLYKAVAQVLRPQYDEVASALSSQKHPGEAQ